MTDRPEPPRPDDDAHVDDRQDPPRPDDDGHLDDQPDPRVLRRTVLLVALLNLGYFFVEIGVAVAIGSVSLFADSVDFLEDTAVNLLIFIALGFSLQHRSLLGKVLAGLILVPAIAAAITAFSKVSDPTPPDVASLVVTAGGAIVVNAACAWLLARVRHHGGSLTTAAFLAARNDVAINALIIVMGVVTALTLSGWPDILLGTAIIALNLSAAREVWEVAEEENLAAKALAGQIDDD